MNNYRPGRHDLAHLNPCQTAHQQTVIAKPLEYSATPLHHLTQHSPAARREVLPKRARVRPLPAHESAVEIDEQTGARSIEPRADRLGDQLHANNGSPERTAAPTSTSGVRQPGLPSSATTGQIGDRPPASTAPGSQLTMTAPALTTSPSWACRVKPAPPSWTVSSPRCTRAECAASEVMTNACGCSLTIVPSIGAIASTTPSRAGSTAMPGPTSSAPKTGSGTSAMARTTPLTGASTVRGAGISAGPRSPRRACPPRAPRRPARRRRTA